MSGDDQQQPGVERVGRFALTEDWWATIAGLTIVVLTMVGVLGDWALPL